MSAPVEIFEVGPRDGLQNEARLIPTEEKVALVDALSECGFARIEPASFVSPKWVPQMADSGEVMARITRARNVQYWALTPNAQGLDRAIAAKMDGVAVFGAATEGFSRANLNASVADSLARFVPLVAEARAHGVGVRGYVSVVTDCPFEGAVPPGAAADVAERLWQMGCTEISLGETLGKGLPERVDRMLTAVLERVPAEALAGHFHDTGGRALANIEVALSHGVRIFDASVGGLGGCPYAPGAPGNVASEAVDALVRGLGYETGLDTEQLARAGQMARAMRKGAVDGHA